MRVVNRRLLTILFPALAAVAVSGCTTFSDNDVIARIGDAELGAEELDELIAAAGLDLGDGATTVNADVAREQIAGWIGSTAQAEGLYVVDQIEPASDAVASARFDQGIETALIACPLAMIVEGPDAGAEAIARLEAGDPYETVFAEFNLNPDLVPVVGDIGCLPLQDLDPTAGDPGVDALLAVDASTQHAVGDLTELSDGEARAILVSFRPYDALPADYVATIRNVVGGLLVREQLDVYVDPRYGAFNPATGLVEALG